MSKGLRYSVEMLDFIKLNYKTIDIKDLTIVFNQRFDLDKTPYQISSVISKNKFINDRNWKASKSKNSVLKSKNSVPSSVKIEQLAFIAETYLVYRAVDIPDLFYQRFGIHKTYRQIKALINNHRIRSGRS